MGNEKQVADEEKNSSGVAVESPRPAQPRRLSWEEVGAVWDTLVLHAGASDHVDHKDTFTIYASGRESVPEYRFQGSLGFGGKVRYLDGKWSVYCYPEDWTAERAAIIATTNDALAMVNIPERDAETVQD